jgi:hypothetical protein
MRAFFVNGVGTMHVPWPGAVEVLPTLQHLSLFLVFGGLAIFLFNVNVDHEVFSYVVWWIGLILHGLITPLSIVRHDSPYHSPHSTLAWFLHINISYVTFKFLAFITVGRYQTWERYCELRDRYRRWVVVGGEGSRGNTVRTVIGHRCPNLRLDSQY